MPSTPASTTRRSRQRSSSSVSEDAAGGTVLTLTESGFDRIPLSRRAEAFRMNDNGWSEQLKNIERHVSQP